MFGSARLALLLESITLLVPEEGEGMTLGVSQEAGRIPAQSETSQEHWVGPEQKWALMLNKVLGAKGVNSST